MTTRRLIASACALVALLAAACGSDAVEDARIDETEPATTELADTATEPAEAAEAERSEPEPEPTEPELVELEEPDDAETTSDGLFPDVVGVNASQDGDGSWRFDVTLSSPYDEVDRYADAWRVRAVDDEAAVYGERILLHDHANEQPFTRSQSGIEIPDGTMIVLVEGRDQINGWGGATMEYLLPTG